MKTIALTEQEIQVVKENLTHKTLKQIMACLPRFSENITSKSARIFARKCKKEGLHRDRYKHKVPYTGTYNQEYWKDLDLIKCYFAGNIAADGCILHKNNSKTLVISVAMKDEVLVDSYIRELDYKGTKIEAMSHSKFAPKEGLPYCRIQLRAFNKNADYLKQHFNLAPQKTKRMGPTNISNDYLNLAYLMGYIDGDGTICCHKTQKGRFETISLSIISCSKPLMEWIVALIDKKFPVINRKAGLRYRKRSHTWEYAIGGLRAATVIDYLRQFPLQEIRLKRKWDNPKLLAWIEKKKIQHPEAFFSPDLAEITSLALRKEPLQSKVSMEALVAEKQIIDTANAARELEKSERKNIKPIKFNSPARLKALKARASQCKIPIILITKDGQYIKEYESITELSKSLGLNVSRLARVCKSNNKQMKGHYFQYKFDYLLQNKETVLDYSPPVSFPLL